MVTANTEQQFIAVDNYSREQALMDTLNAKRESLLDGDWIQYVWELVEFLPKADSASDNVIPDESSALEAECGTKVGDPQKENKEQEQEKAEKAEKEEEQETDHDIARNESALASEGLASVESTTKAHIVADSMDSAVDITEATESIEIEQVEVEQTEIEQNLFYPASENAMQAAAQDDQRSNASTEHESFVESSDPAEETRTLLAELSLPTAFSELFTKDLVDSNPSTHKEEREIQCLLFKINGQQLIAPLLELGHIYNITRSFEVAEEMPAWLKGRYLEKGVDAFVIDGVKTLLSSDSEHKDPSYVISFGDGEWGVTCDEITKALYVPQSGIRWRKHSGSRCPSTPWYTGIAVEYMCPMVNIQLLYKALSRD